MDAYNVILEDELANQPCEICKQSEPIGQLLLCDHCSRAFHMHCVNMSDVPLMEWYCSECIAYLQMLNNSNSPALDPTENADLRTYLEDPQTLDDLAPQSQVEVQALSQKFTLIDGYLCYTGGQGFKRVPTIGEWALIVKQIHQAMGHYGSVKTLDMVRQCYWWPNMSTFVTTLVKKCLLCQANHARYPQLRQSYAIQKGVRPFTHVSVDLFYLPTSQDSYRYVVVGIDSFTKWPEASPLLQRDSKTLFEWIHREIVCRYGTPFVVRTDNGGEFMGLFHQYLVDQGIQHVVGSPFYPQTQGQVERIHETIKNGIRKLFNTMEYRDSWPQILPNVMLGIRTLVSRATKYSPSQLLMGRDLVLPRHKVVPTQYYYEPPTEEQVRDYFEEFVNQLDVDRHQVFEHLAKMDVEIRRTIDKRRKRIPPHLEEGDMIIIKADPASGRNALQIDANGPMVFLEYSDQECNAIRYYDPETRLYGRASVTNVKLLNV